MKIVALEDLAICQRNKGLRENHRQYDMVLFQTSDCYDHPNIQVVHIHGHVQIKNDTSQQSNHLSYMSLFLRQAEMGSMSSIPF